MSFLKKVSQEVNAYLSKNKVQTRQPSQTTDLSSSEFLMYGNANYNPIIDEIWDGEKTAGELGAVINTTTDNLKLRLRAYDMNLKTDIIKIITGKFFKWVIGVGLKIQCEPSEAVLNMFGVKEDLEKFKLETEALFNLYVSSEYSDYTGRDNFHVKALESYETAFLGGDCLCIVRTNEIGPNMQVVDGQQVTTPIEDEEKEEGNTIFDGIEVNEKGEHVAFWVHALRNDENGVIEMAHTRIKAKDSLGNKVAWMVYGLKARINNHRGIPVISSILEKVAKLDRFVEASVSKAEKTADVVFAFEHNKDSTGENVLTESLTSVDLGEGDETPESDYDKTGRTANMLRQSTSGTVINLTPGSELVTLSNPSEITFNEFFRAVFTTICAAVDIPEEVALQKYEQNYSSSRAAINGWEYIAEIHRSKHADKSYKPFYRIWLQKQIFDGVLKSAGFLKADYDNNKMLLEAFYKSRFTGKKMPHIDPLKEAKAIRVLLGDSNAALISHEQATELMNGGDWIENFKKFLKEGKMIPKPEPEVVPGAPIVKKTEVKKEKTNG